VFLSSHLMSEMALTADHLIVVGRGRLIADASVDEFLRRHSKKVVRVLSPQAAELVAAVSGPDVSVVTIEPGLLVVEGLTAEQIGEQAARGGLVLHELTPQQVTLEEAFMDITQGELEFRAHAHLEAARETEGAAA
jgi:ABC-2 type transport system ATP-binding protein